GPTPVSGHRCQERNGRQPQPSRIDDDGIESGQNGGSMHDGGVEADNQQTEITGAYSCSHVRPCLTSTTSGTFSCTTFCMRLRIVSRTESSSSGTSKINSSWT